LALEHDLDVMVHRVRAVGELGAERAALHLLEASASTHSFNPLPIAWYAR